MFGHDDMNPQQGNQGGMPLPSPDATLAHSSTPTVTPPAHQAPALPTGDDDQATGGTAPAVDDSSTNDTAGDFIMDDAPATAADLASAAPAVSTPAADTSSVSTDELLDIKQGALQQLTPLLGHLEQSPEEQFRTTMMMIQASDNQALLKAAYEAAQQIEDEKTKAQALLDVVNEINYFTQQSESSQADAGQETA